MTEKQKQEQEQAKNRPQIVKRRRGANGKAKVEVLNVVPIKGRAPVEVLGADETHANSVHIKIMDLMKRYEETYFSLAQQLYDVKAKKLYRSLDGGKYETFQQYVEEGIGIDYRKAQHLTKMWWWYGIEQNANPKLLEGAIEIGWTKSKELVEIIDGRNAKRWFKLAKQMNAVDLGRAARVAKKKAAEKKKEKAKVASQEREREARGTVIDMPLDSSEEPSEEQQEDQGGKVAKLNPPKPPKVALPVATESQDGTEPAPADNVGETRGIDVPEDIEERVASQKAEKEKWKRYHYDVHKDNWETVNDAFIYAGDLAESDHKGHILSLICLHYNSFHDGQKPVVIGEWLAQFERLTGLSVVALDRRQDEIVYGAELIEELAGKEEEGDADDGESGVGT